MQPSSKYASTEKTSSNFTYKETDNNIATLFTLNSDIDLSIAYSSNNIADYSKYSMACWSSNAHTWYVAQNVYADIPWDYSSSSHRHSYIKNVSVAKGWASNLSCKLYNIFLTGNSQNREFNFGYNTSASSTEGSFTSKIVSDFDVNKVVFTASLTGLTKTEWNTFLTDNTVTSNHSISMSDFLDNPSDYMISDFQVKSLATWNSGTDKWSANELIYPTAMIDSEQMRSIVGYKVLFYKNLHMGCTSNYDGANLYCDNLTVYTGAYQYGTMTNEVNATDGFILGSGLDNLSVLPQVPSEELIDKATNGITGTFSTSWKKFDIGNNFIDMYESDTYTYAADPYPVGASTSHPNAYKKHFRQMIKGDKVSECLAQIGVYFWTDTVSELNNNSTCTPDTMGDSSKMYLGVMAASGITNGTWIHGNDINNYTGINKGGSIIHPNYNPSGGGGGTDEDNDDEITTTGAPYAAGLVNYYAMTAGSPLIGHISEALSTWDLQNTSKDLYKNLISCKLIKPPAPIPTSGSEPFTIYGVKPQYGGADITLPVVSGNPNASFGPYSISRKFNDFRDYAPYTRVCIYLPYCGWCDLPSHVVGRSVSVHYYTDIIAATCKAVVFCGNNIIAEAAGVIGLDIPFVADNVGAKMQAVTAGMIAALGGGIQLGAGVGTMVSTKSGSGAKAALSGASQYLSGYSQMAMAFNENTTEISGKNGDGCCLSGATNIIIKIVRPKKGAYTTAPYTPPGYGHNVGFVSQKQVRVSSVSGLLIADNVDTSGISGATEAERAEIKRVLETGLIVNAAPE